MTIPAPTVIDQSAVPWETWPDPAVAARSPSRWKLLITGERTGTAGLVTGVAQLAPGEHFLSHRHEPEETYYVVSGRGEVDIDGQAVPIGPGCAIHIPSNATHALRCTGAKPLFLVFSFPRDRFDEITYHFGW